jgi:hypothetical protein
MTNITIGSFLIGFFVAVGWNVGELTIAFIKGFYEGYKLSKNNMTNLKEEILKEFVEKGADIEHDRWARWQKYMFSRCEVNSDGTVTVPSWAVERWFRQIDTPYSELSEAEKESDRNEARNYLPFLSSAIDRAYKQGAKDMAEAVRLGKIYADAEDDRPIHPQDYEHPWSGGYNQAIDETNQKAKEFMEKL